MENENKLTVISQSSLLNKVNSSVEITNKLITENNKKLVAEIFERNPKFCIDLISEFYPLTTEILSYEKFLNWERLCRKNNLTQLLNELHISNFDKIKSVNWSQLSDNQNIEWSNHLLHLLEDKLKWDSLSMNKTVPWTLDLVEKYFKKIEWYLLSSNKGISFDTKFIEKFSDNLKFKYLSENQKIQWTEHLLDKFENMWDWENLFLKGTFWNDKYIIKYYDKISKKMWWYLSRNEISWPLNVIEKYVNNWDWESLSHNEKFVWDEDYIKLHKDRINFRHLSYNSTMQWSYELLEQYEDKWNWEVLSYNKNLPWSEKLISKYQSRWRWFDFKYPTDLSSNENLPWSDNFIEKYADKWNWNNLIKNKGVKWSVKLLHKYPDKLIYPSIYNSPTAIWNALQPYIDDELVIKLLDDIKKAEKYINS